MDASCQSHTPTTPALPQESPTAASNNIRVAVQLPLSPASSHRRNTSVKVRVGSSTLSKQPALSSGSTSTANTAPPHLRLTLYTRRALRRRQAISNNCYRTHHYRQFFHLLRPLQPLVSIETGLSHPSFPRNMLQYHLLSHAQLDALAEHYHQAVPSYYSLGYPTNVVGRWWAPSLEDDDLMVRDQHFEALMEEARDTLRDIGVESVDATMMGVESVGKSVDVRENVGNDDGEAKRRRAAEMIIEDKRRRFGRFIGLRDCESPGTEDEQVIERAMEAWVWGELERRIRLEADLEVGTGKRGW